MSLPKTVDLNVRVAGRFAKRNTDHFIGWFLGLADGSCRRCAIMSERLRCRCWFVSRPITLDTNNSILLAG
jgi:hypothetical protein